MTRPFDTITHTHTHSHTYAHTHTHTYKIWTPWHIKVPSKLSHIHTCTYSINGSWSGASSSLASSNIFWKPLVNHKQKYFRHDPACVETSRAGFGLEAAPARLLPVLYHVRNLKIAYYCAMSGDHDLAAQQSGLAALMIIDLFLF